MDQSEIKKVLQSVRASMPPVAANRDVMARLDELIRERSVVPVPFMHTMTTAAAGLAAAGVANLQAAIPDDYLIQGGTYFADIAAAAQTASTRVVPLVTVNLTNVGSGYQFADAAVPLTSLFGPGGDVPYIWPEPKFLQANSTLQAQLTSFVAAGTTYNIRLVFHGVKLYRG